MDVIIKLGGISLKCRDITSQEQASIARHRYPGHNGADLEFLGWAANNYRLRCLFNGDDGIEQWEGIRSKLRTGALVALEHPVDGTISGLIESVNATEDNRRNCVEVEFSFLEDGVDKPASYRPQAAAIASESAQPLVDAAASLIASQFGNTAIPSPDLTDNNWFEKLGDMGNAINALVRGIRTDVRRLDGLIAAVTAPVSVAFNALAFAADLPGQLTMRITKVMDLMQGKVEGAPSPTASAMKFLRDLDALVATFRGQPSEGAARVLGASQAARTVAILMERDEDRLRAMQAYEQEPSFDLRGNWIGKAAAPKSMPASVTEIANLVGAARTTIQGARPFAPDPSALDTLAAALQDQYKDRIVRFETVREITVLTPTPLHLICHQNGLPYNAAERVALLNPQIQNPTFAEGRILIYAP